MANATSVFKVMFSGCCECFQKRPLPPTGVNMTEPLAFTMEDLIKGFKSSRATIYAEIKAGRLQTYTLGRRRYATPAAALAWQRALEAGTPCALPTDVPAAE
jgi:hypothetical protein